jgi:hypothetical protein
MVHGPKRGHNFATHFMHDPDYHPPAKVAKLLARLTAYPDDDPRAARTAQKHCPK